MIRVCASCGVQGRWHSTICGPCRKLLRATPAPGRAEVWAARSEVLLAERWVLDETDGLYYPREARTA